MILKVPAERPDNLVSVIEVDIVGDPVVNKTTGVDPVYITSIPVAFARAEGCSVKEKSWMEKFGEWKHIYQAQNWTSDARLIWEVDILEPGDYQVDLNYAGKGRMVWRIASNEDGFVQNQQNSSDIYSYYEMGLLSFTRSGKHVITVTFVEGERETASLKEIRLTPLKSLE